MKRTTKEVGYWTCSHSAAVSMNVVADLANENVQLEDIQ